MNYLEMLLNNKLGRITVYINDVFYQIVISSNVVHKNDNLLIES